MEDSVYTVVVYILERGFLIQALSWNMLLYVHAGSDMSVMTSPPPAPPPLPLLSQTVRQKVMTHANMPSLNWTPLKDVTGSIFQVCSNVEHIKHGC